MRLITLIPLFWHLVNWNRALNSWGNLIHYFYVPLDNLLENIPYILSHLALFYTQSRNSKLEYDFHVDFPPPPHNIFKFIKLIQLWPRKWENNCTLEALKLISLHDFPCSTTDGKRANTCSIKIFCSSRRNPFYVIVINHTQKNVVVLAWHKFRYRHVMKRN